MQTLPTINPSIKTSETTADALGTLLAPTLLADSDHPRVRELAARLSAGLAGDAEKADSLANFVSRHIAFGLPPGGDETSASRTLALGYGHPTARATLLVALARAAGIPARIHYARFDKAIYKELVPGWAYALLPQQAAVAWAELYVEGAWRPRPDAGHDPEYARAAHFYLRERGQLTGAGLVVEPHVSLRDWNERLAERLPLVADEGVFRDVMDYIWSERYPMRPKHPLVAWLLCPLGRDEFSRRAEEIRRTAALYADGLAAA